MPRSDSLGFLRRQGGEDQVRVPGLPGQRFGLIQGQVKHLFLPAKHVTEFGKNRVFRFVDLADELSAGGQTRLP